MTSEERLLELVVSVMRDKRPMTDGQIVRAVYRRARVKTDTKSVRLVLKANSRRFRLVRSGPNFWPRSVRWCLVEAGPADDPGHAGAPVPARPYRPMLSGAAAVPLAFREEEPPTGAIGRAV